MVTSGPDFSLWIDHTTAWLCTRDHKHRKVRATPVLLLCRLLTYRFLSNGRLHKRRVFHPLPRLCNWSFRPTRLEVPRQAFLPSFPVFHTQQVDVRSFAFDFGRLLVIDRRNSFGRLRRMCFNGYALSKQPKRGIELEPGADLLSPGPSQRQPCIVWHEARDRRHLLERARPHTRVPIHEKGASCSRLTPQCLHSPSAESHKEKGEGQVYYRRVTYLSANRADYKQSSW